MRKLYTLTVVGILVLAVGFVVINDKLENKKELNFIETYGVKYNFPLSENVKSIDDIQLKYLEEKSMNTGVNY